MKKINTITLAVALFISAASLSFAQTPPSGGGGGGGGTAVQTGFPVTKAMLDTYAESLITQANVQMWAPSALENFYTNILYEGKVADVRALAKLPNTVRPKILVGNPEDIINYYVRYESARVPGVDYPYTLFWGGDSKKPVAVKGGWGLPTFNTGKLSRTDRVPYRVKGLVNTHMVIRDENGRYLDTYYFDEDNRIDRQNGILWLGDEQMDRIGELFIERRDESGQNVTDTINLVSERWVAPEQLVSVDVNVGLPSEPLPDDTALIKPRILASNERSSIVFYVEYTRITDVTVAFDPYPSNLNVDISVISAEGLLEGPEGWQPVEPKQYRVEAGSRLFFRYEWGPKNTVPVTSQPPGKG